MKLATIRTGGRDGRLAVVSRDLRLASWAPAPWATMQRAMDDWTAAKDPLAAVCETLSVGASGSGFRFEPAHCMAPLPRAYQWADASAYVNHVELVRRARGADMPAAFWSEPLIYQGGSDDLAGPCDDIVVADEGWGIDFESEVVVITGDVPMGAGAAEAERAVRLVTLCNDVTLRNLVPGEIAKGFGFFQSKPATAFAPVAVTPDELNGAWRQGRVHLPLVTSLNRVEFGRPNAGVDMVFEFPKIIAHAVRTRRAGAGSLFGSGTVSNKDRSTGCSCIAEKRAIETIEQGKPVTPFMKFGDRIHIEMRGDGGQSIFGAIDQKVVPYPIRQGVSA